MGEKLITQMRETKLRAVPTPDGEVIGIIPKGTEVEVYEERDGYYGVRAYVVDQGQVSGFVFKSLIGSFEPSDKKTIGEQAVPLPPCQACGAEDWRYVSLRTSGGAGYQYIPTGFFTSVEVRGRVCLSCGMVIPCIDYDGIQALKGIVGGSPRRTSHA